MSLSECVYSVSYYKTERLVELTWLPGTREITDKDFQESLSVFAEGALQHHAKHLIVDMRQFLSRPSAEVSAWRDEVIIPKYKQAGVEKLAWVWPGAPAGWTGSGADAKERYFETRDEAVSWLLSAGS